MHFIREPMYFIFIAVVQGEIKKNSRALTLGRIEVCRGSRMVFVATVLTMLTTRSRGLEGTC